MTMVTQLKQIILSAKPRRNLVLALAKPNLLYLVGIVLYWVYKFAFLFNFLGRHITIWQSSEKI